MLSDGRGDQSRNSRLVPLHKEKGGKVSRTITFAGDQISKQVQAFYEKDLGSLAKEWDTDIIMCLCHGKYDVVPQEMSFDKLYIFVQLLPREFEVVKKSTIKSYKMDGKDVIFPVKEESPQKCPQGDTLVFTKAPERAEIVRDDDGVPMAVIYDGVVYILNDFIHCRSKEELDISSKIFHYIIDKTVTETGVLRHLKAGVEEKSKRSLEAALRVQFTTRLDKEMIQFRAASDTITQYEKGISEAVRKMTATEKIVEAIRRNISDIPSALEKTWKSLMKMQGSKTYTNISFTKTGIKAVTTPIVIRHQSSDYDMGRYEVTLSFDGTCRIIALDRKMENNDHPHINNGQVCWGNFAGYIPKLIGSSEFDVALVQIYTFLCHYDQNSPYKTIDAWPKLKKAKEEDSEELKARE